jgi:FtsH-binding integral membrane protein
VDNTNSVFDRTGHNEISGNLYNLVIGLCLLWGFGVNFLIVQSVDPMSIAGVSPWLFYGGFFVSSFAGIWLFNSSQIPAVSFLGYNLVVIPFGFVINVAVHQYDPDIVGKAILNTGLVTGVMMLLGTAYPAFFAKISKALFIALIVTIIVELIMIFVFKTDSSVIDWIVVGIFCGYIGYDWGRANQIPKTVDNAIDSAAALYMDIINLFLRLLKIMGNKD